jgi:hypothetical protein
MNTLSKQTPLPTQSSPFTSNNDTNVTGNNSSLPTFGSRDLQTEFEAQPPNSSSTQTHFYQNQQPQVRILHILFKSHYHSLHIDCSDISVLKFK